jgi:hypothetical protein
MSGLWQGWRERAYLHRAIGNFHKLDDHLLRDIGLTRAEYCFLRMSRAATAPVDRKNSRNLHDRPPSSLYVSTVTEFRKPEIVA